VDALRDGVSDDDALEIIARTMAAVREPLLRTALVHNVPPDEVAQQLAFDFVRDEGGWLWLIEIEPDPAWPGLEARTDGISLFPTPAGSDSWKWLTVVRPDDTEADEARAECPVPASGAKTWPLADGSVIWTPAGEVVSLNASGTYVWAALCDGMTPEDISRELVTELGVAADHAQRDVSLLVGKLTDHEALVPQADAGTDAHDDVRLTRPEPVSSISWNAERLYVFPGATVSLRLPARGWDGLRTSPYGRRHAMIFRSLTQRSR
jgi:hypothetical protein